MKAFQIKKNFGAGTTATFFWNIMQLKESQISLSM